MNSSKRILLAGLLLLIALVLTYRNHFNNPFHFDDAHTIVNNNAIKDIGNIPRFFKDATTTSSLPPNQAYRPGLTTLNAIDHWIGGKPEPDPFYFHVSIFVSFALLGVMLYFFMLDIFNRSRPHRWNPWFALFGAGLFCLHTANAETINYIIARSDSFSTVMIVLGLVMYIYMPVARKLFLYLIPVIFGFFVKEPVAMFGPLLFFYILFFEKNTALTDITRKEKFPAFLSSFVKVLPALLLAALLFWISRKMTPETWTGGGGSIKSYVMTQTFVVVHYFANFILPVNLSADTDWTLITRVWDLRVLVGTGFIVLLAIIAFCTSRKQELRPIAFGIVWFFLALLPTSVMPLAEVLNDHRVFFPYIGLVIAATWLIAHYVIKYESMLVRASGWRIAVIVLLSGLLLGHAYGTHHRNKVWSTSESLWKDVTLKSPGNARGWMNYGNALMARGDYAGAEQCYLKAKEIWPYYSYLYINFGILKASTGRLQEGEADYRLAIQYGPQNPEAFYYFAKWLKEQKRFDEAYDIAQRGLAISPEHSFMRLLLSEIEQSRKPQEARVDEAIKTASNNPTPENYLTLSLEFYLAGKYDKCIEAAQEAIKLKPDYAEAWNNICSAHNKLGNFEEAEKACSKSLELKPGYELAKNNLLQVQQRKSALDNALKALDQSKTPENYLNLSLIYYTQEQYEKCIEAAQEALKLKPDYDLAWNNICTAYNMLKEWDKAIEAGEKAVALNPANQLARNNLAEAKRQKAIGSKK